MHSRPKISELRQQLDSAKTSSKDLVMQSLQQIKLAEKQEKWGRLFLSLREEEALSEAAASDARITAGKPLSKLDGIPIAIKDNIVVAGGVATCGSRFLENYRSPYDSHVVESLKQAGAIIVGKTNMDEFAMGSSNEYSAFGVARNPWNRECVPGGSSGASAAAVAAGLVPLSLGSDTGGSIRQPASFCGVVGLKPTYGRVSRYGLVAFASSLDQIGPMSWWVEDTATLLSAIAGHDRRDSTSADVASEQYENALQGDLKGLRIGLAESFVPAGFSDEARENFLTTVDTLKGLGAKTVTIDLPHTKYAVGVYYVVASAEASANLARFDGVRYTKRVDSGDGLKQLFTQSRTEGFGEEVKRRIMLGTYVLSSGYYDAYYTKARKVRELIRRDFTEAFKECDVILTPTSPCGAFAIGGRTKDPLQMYLCDVFTTSVSLAGLPAISVPSGFSSAGMPFGLQIIAPHFRESELLRVGHLYQQATDWQDKLP